MLDIRATGPASPGAAPGDEPGRKAIQLSVVVPVYGCGKCLRSLHARLRLAVESIVERYELIFVEDRSPDEAWDILRELAAADPAVRALRLSRNFGQHAAITAGLAESRGRWVVVMDCDLQDPPEHIPVMWSKAMNGGVDVVLSRRRERRQPLLRRATASAYFRVHNMLLRGDMHTNYSNISLISRKVADAFLTLKDRDRQYLLILHWLGFRHAVTEVEQEDRPAGSSSYTFSSLVRVAVDGLFFQSSVLLRWIVYSGFVIAGLGVLLAIYALVVAVFGRHMPQWTALPVFILLLTGFMIISTGVTGLYVGKIFDQVKGRPLYVVDTRVVAGLERGTSRDLESYAATGGEPPEPSTEVHPIPSDADLRT